LFFPKFRDTHKGIFRCLRGEQQSFERRMATICMMVVGRRITPGSELAAAPGKVTE
jgi:hypothetical protein